MLTVSDVVVVVNIFVTGNHEFTHLWFQPQFCLILSHQDCWIWWRWVMLLFLSIYLWQAITSSLTFDFSPNFVSLYSYTHYTKKYNDFSWILRKNPDILNFPGSLYNHYTIIHDLQFDSMDPKSGKNKVLLSTKHIYSVEQYM